MRRFFWIVAASLVVAVLCGAPATFDGGYYLYRLLEQGSPFVPNRRLLHALLQAPAVLAARFSEGVLAPGLVFGLAYASTPLWALAACWWLVRGRAPEAFVWAAFGIGIATLPGQIAFVSEGAVAVQLAWVLWLAVLTGIRRRQAALLLCVAAIVFFSHPGGSVLFALAAGLAVWMGLWHPGERRAQWTSALVFAVLAAGAGLRFALGANSYELEQLSLDLLPRRFGRGVVGLPLVVLLGAAGAALALLAASRPQRRSPAARRLVLAPLLVAGLAAVAYGALPRLWQHALEFRFFVIPASLPFLAAAAWEGAGRRPQGAPDPGLRRSVAECIALVFALVVVAQSLTWAAMSVSLRRFLADTELACASLELPALAWTEATALSHWSITPWSLLLQGRRPEAVILPGDRCATADFTTGLPVTDWDSRSWQGGWLALDALERRLRPTAE